MAMNSYLGLFAKRIFERKHTIFYIIHKKCACTIGNVNTIRTVALHQLSLFRQ